jgi:hypothetical protein
LPRHRLVDAVTSKETLCLTLKVIGKYGTCTRDESGVGGALSIVPWGEASRVETDVTAGKQLPDAHGRVPTP